MRRVLLAAGVAVLVALAAPRAFCGGQDPVETLKKGLKDDRPEARAEAARGIGKAAPVLSDDERRRVALVLRKAIETEPLSLVRVEEVKALAQLKDEAGWVPVLVAATSDKDPDVRAAAVREALLARSDLVGVIAKLLREDQDPTFRADLLLLAGKRRKRDAVPILLETLSDPHPRVASAAAEALEAVTGQALGYEVGPWKTWWAKETAIPAAPAMGDTVTGTPEPKVPDPPPPARGLIPDFHGIPLRAKDLVFVVDVSGSIGAAGFDGAKAELVKAVERLPSDARFAALFFDEEVRTWHAEMTLATPEAKADLARFVRGIPRGKRTDVMTPLLAGLGIVRKRVDAKTAAKEAFAEPVTMIVVSDGQENLRQTPGEVVGEHLDRLDLAHSVVHAVVLGGRDNALMLALARRAGGRYVVLP